MDLSIGDARVHYVEHGDGTPLIALHGAGVDHREIEAAIEGLGPEAPLRRIYPDLPGMGRSSASGLTSNDDVTMLLGEFIERLGLGAVLLIGHSYGAYLARGLAARRPDLVHGLALICPLAGQSRNVPGQEVVHQDADAYDELEPAQRPGFDEYFVVRTRATARRYRYHVVPGTTLVDEQAVGRIFDGWALEIGPDAFPGPTLIVAGRRDPIVGYTDSVELLEHYPRASLAIVDEAGHALMHERPDVLAALLADWLDRVRTDAG